MSLQEIRETVSALMDCLVREQPGLACTMAQGFMSVSYRNTLGTTAVEHYTSIFTFDDRRQARHRRISSIPYYHPNDVLLQEARFEIRKNIENFLFNFMGSRLAEEASNTDSQKACDLRKRSCDSEEGTVRLSSLQLVMSH